jgi:NAD(P)-dependent dehydrogenase (short-subunit alcohol dehydrogenase family)
MSKKILISGASRGLGFALAEKYLQAGWIVYAGVRDVQAAPMLTLKKKFPEALFLLLLDVSDTAQVRRAAQQLQAATDTLDVIINNAAIQLKSSPAILENIDIDETLETYNINTLGALRVTQAFLPFLRKGESRMLVNISSEAGSIGQCGRMTEMDYCMSKAALNMQSVIAQNYLKQDQIKVLAIHPGWMRTDMGGPDALLSAEEGAADVFRLIEMYKGNLDAPIFLDYSGQVLKW